MTSGKLEKLSAIPTNIISGFLGVGKTSAILSLLEAKPEHERWAVLVNEFGEIGIDGGFLRAYIPNKAVCLCVKYPAAVCAVLQGCLCKLRLISYLHALDPIVYS